MDLTKQLADKISAFPDARQKRFLEKVVHHIEIAEQHLEAGRRGQDHLFNDAIYRTNQAFEGSLKVAYEIFTENTDSTSTPFQIENYFEQNRLLRPRVLELFRNYRKHWRNPSTHDYTLVFAGQEAFLAIVSISAFLSILLDEMLTKKAYTRTAESTSKQRPRLPADYEQLPFFDQVSELLKSSATHFSTAYHGIYSNEREMILNSEIEAFLKTADPNIRIAREPITDEEGLSLRPDLILYKGSESVVLELKVERALPKAQQREMGVRQIATYLKTTSKDAGILFVAPWQAEEIRSEDKNIDDLKIRVIYGFSKPRT